MQGTGVRIESGGAGVGFVGSDKVEDVRPEDFGLMIEKLHGNDVGEGEVGGEVLVDEVDTVLVFEIKVNDGKVSKEIRSGWKVGGCESLGRGAAGGPVLTDGGSLDEAGGLLLATGFNGDGRKGG
jgi:hypothetical protein